MNEPFPPYIEPSLSNASKMVAPAPLKPDELRSLPSQTRSALVQDGQNVDILIGNKHITSIPWLLFRAISTRALDVEHLDSNRLALRLPEGLSRAPFVYISAYLLDVSFQESVSLLPRRESIVEDISVCRAARLLGLVEYTQHIFEYYLVFLKNANLNFGNVDAVEKLALTEQKLGLMGYDGQAMLECMAARLAGMLQECDQGTVEVVQGYLSRHPKVLVAVNDVVSKMDAGRVSAKSDSDIHPSPWGIPISKPQSAVPLNGHQVNGHSRRESLLMSSSQKLRTFTVGEPTLTGLGKPEFQHMPKTSVSSLEKAQPSQTKYGAIGQELKRRSTGATHKPKHSKGSSHFTSLPTSLDQAAPPAKDVEKSSNPEKQAAGRPSTSERAENPSKEDQQTNSVTTSGNTEGQASSSAPSLLELAKAMFPPPTDAESVNETVQQHTFALLEQNQLFRFERYRSTVDPDAVFSNPKWAELYSPPCPPAATAGTETHRKGHQSRNSVALGHPSSSMSGPAAGTEQYTSEHRLV
ncbi:hypothetical protein M011DRAFT_468324 [Sporormia fimetaria CBS 119925]|uniref:Uncharacterized protein n=1 Tax=Sporormia fimetaria CBS 119925 TaxID=1340428 RepID=A0A6A6V7Y0_9PLEO|nr:hypothetical protein M011DRAFT_468324 [Sporormia fimetaria CBS 119925]